MRARLTAQNPLFKIAIVGPLPWGSSGHDKRKHPVNNHGHFEPAWRAVERDATSGHGRFDLSGVLAYDTGRTSDERSSALIGRLASEFWGSIMPGRLAVSLLLVARSFGWLLALYLVAPSTSGVDDAAGSFRAIRFAQNPIIHPRMPGWTGDDGANINGPSLIRVPDWVEKPLGRYYLYFAHHGGKYIRLAYADALEGPWKLLPGGVLGLADAPGVGHIASPDVHVDAESRRIRMYFHQPAPKGSPIPGQVSFVALSDDGLHFTARPEVLGKFYFRVVRHGGWHYAFAKNGNIDGVIYRSRDGLTGFEEGPHYVPGVRHTAMWLEHDTLYLLYTKVGDVPERILLSTIDLSGDWMSWKVSEPRVLLEPEKDYEGASLPLSPSRYGAARGPVRQLRDPAVFAEEGRRYLLYSVAGEQGIALARLVPDGS